jgi:beta-aspartyl-dipeptidase (metallo-type)
VDLEGRKVIPGLIDGHAHLTGGGGESGYASRVPPVPLSRFTRAGVTSVVGVLGTDDVTRSTESLVAAAYGLREEGIGAWCHCGGYHLPPVTLSGSVRRDIVFVDPVIGVGEVAISDHRSSQPTLAEILRLAGDAHVAGMMTGKAGILHLHMGDGSRGLELIDRALATSEIPARVFNPTHVNRQRALLDEAVELARRGSTVDITAYPVAEDDPSVPAAVALADFLESGAPADKVTVSSDGGGCLPHFDGDGVLTRMDIGNPAVLLETLAALVADGLALERALPAFTSNAASLLRLAGRGRVAIGGIADLVVLDDDGGAHSVMARGRWHVRNREPVVRGTFENSL